MIHCSYLFVILCFYIIIIVFSLKFTLTDNFAQRTAVRAALGADEVWQQKYFQHILKMMTKQENAVLKKIPNIPIHSEPRKEGGKCED